MRSMHSLSLEAFLDLFNIKEVKELNKNGNISAAVDALIDYYRCRKIPSWPEPAANITDLRLNLETINNKQLIQKAESILENRFLPDRRKPVLSDTGDILWNRSPISSPEWLWRLHRHQWWPVLGLAYRQTGDERYTKAFVQQMLSWVRENPILTHKNEKSSAWRLMECGMRMHVSWIPSFGLFFSSPVFDQKAKIAMLRSIYDHAQFLSSFRTSQNHLLRECNGLASVSVYFPEFNRSKRWLKIALTRLNAELKKQINPDGFHFELSTGYHWVAIDEFEKTHELLKIADLLLQDTHLQRQLEKMYHVLAYVVRPDGSFPEVNDGFIRWSSNRLVKAGKGFKRDDFIYIGTNGTQGAVPPITSTAFKNAGYYVMRSDWSKNAKYLLFDCGPCSGFHGHEDKLSIEVFAFGIPFIVDSGSYTYENSDPYRAYFVGSQSHNTLMVDGRSQIRRWIGDSLKTKKSWHEQAVWIQKADFDYAMGIYDEGYGKFALEKPKGADIVEDVTHTRHILFVKPDYWLVVDELQATALHNYQLLFHGHPESEIYIEDEKAVTIKRKGNNACLYLIPAETEKIKIDLKTGCQTPIQGWYSLDHHFKTPSTAVIYESEKADSTIMTTLIYPLQTKPSNGSIQIEPIEVNGGKGIAYKVVAHRGTDFLMLSSHEGLKKFGDYQSEKTVAGFRLDKNGQLISRFES
jgi:hypothetical protein